MSGIGAKSQTGEERVWRPNPLTHRLELPPIHLSQSRPRTRNHNREASSFMRLSFSMLPDRQTEWNTHTHAHRRTHGRMMHKPIYSAVRYRDAQMLTWPQHAPASLISCSRNIQTCTLRRIISLKSRTLSVLRTPFTVWVKQWKVEGISSSSQCVHSPSLLIRL